MKSSRSSNKALFLSLSLIALVASGCERRGRAPITSVSAGPLLSTSSTNPTPMTNAASPTPTTGSTPGTTVTTSNGTTSTTKTTTTSTTGANSSVAPANEQQLITDAQMKCAAASVDDTGSPSKASFLADIALEVSFQDCMNAAGLTVSMTNKETTRDWSVDSSPDPKDKSAAYKMFLTLASASGSDDVKAQTIMKARAQLSALRLGKMSTKYSDDRMRSADFATTDVLTDDKGNKYKVGETLSDIAKTVTALNASLTDIAAMQSVSNGGMTSAEINSRNQNSQTVQK
jgi:hypothetical protein